MKKILLGCLLFIILASLTLSLASCNKSGDAPAGMITASHESVGYSFYVPDDWTVDLSTNAAGAYYSANDPSSVSVISWELENSDSTVDDWWAINLPDIELVFSDVEVVSEENTTVSEIYGKKFVYTASLGEYDYKIMQVAVVKKAVVYVFTYTSVVDNYDLHIDDVNMMLQYLTVK